MSTITQPGTGSDNTVALLVPDTLLEFWPQVRVVMEAHPEGLLDGWDTIEGVFKRILTGEYQLWIGFNSDYQIEAVQLTRKEVYPGFTICRIVWAGGKFAPYAKANIESLKAYCRYIGADKLAFDGRLGWVKRMEKFGFRQIRAEMWMPVERSN